MNNKRVDLLVLGTFCIVIAFVIFALMPLCGCENDGCKTEETRCNGSALEICNADHNWEIITDCAAFEPMRGEFVCCLAGDEHQCVLPEQCD